MPRLKRRSVVDLIAWLHAKRSVKSVKNDALNWARAIYVAQLYYDTTSIESGSVRARTRTNNSKATALQTSACQALEQSCQPYDNVYSFLENAAAFLGNCTAIFVWTNVTPEPAFKIGSTNPNIVLRLVLAVDTREEDTNGITTLTTRDTLYVLTNRKAFNSKKYECLYCNKLFQRDGQHRCIDSRHFARSANFKCCACGKVFNSTSSLNTHEDKCDAEQCSDCGKLFRLSDKRELDEHLCDERWCRACKLIVPNNHLCCLQPLDVPKLETPADGDDDNHCSLVNMHRIIAFDVETDCSTGTHEAILICAERSTDGCRQTFYGVSCLTKFCQWLFGPQHSNYVVVAHNFSGFDSVFLMKYLHQSMLQPEVTLRGNKIISLTLPEWNIRCVDFLLFCPMPLAKIPSALGVAEVAKGYFPHAFTRPENYNYIGALPAASYFQPQHMKRSDQLTFLTWYEQQQQQQNLIFDFKATLISYCQNDVDVLLQSVLKYRAMFIELSDGIDPFDCCTLPQACFKTFRARHLKPNLFGILPVGGYNSGESNSYMARTWIAYETRLDDEHVRTTWDNGELRIRNYKVDASTSTRFLEFYGCYYHGCLNCFQRTWYNKTVGKLFGRLHDDTMKRQAALERFKPVTSIYECQWKALRKTPEIQAFLANLKFRAPLTPTIYGGRCEVFRTITTTDDQTEILMFDFVSFF